MHPLRHNDHHIPFEMQYRLARTVVKIDGTVTTETDASGAPKHSTTSSVSLAVEAEPGVKGLRKVRVDSKYFASTSLDLSLAADGRLAGAGQTASGVGGELVSAGLSVAKTALAAATALRIAPEPDGHQKLSVDARYAKEQTAAAERRKAMAETVSKLESELAEHLNKAAASPSKDVGAALSVIEAALAAARTEYASLQAAFETWRSTTYPTSTEAFTELLGTDELASIPEAKETYELSEFGSPAKKLTKTLHTVVALVADTERVNSPATSKNGQPLAATEELEYRIPRRVEIAVYKAHDDEPSKYHLQSLAPAWIIDDHSPVGRLPLHCGVFEKESMTVSFGESGTLTQLANSKTPGISGIASAIGGAAGDVTGIVEGAAKLAAPATPADPSLKALEQQVTRKELEARLATASRTISGGGTRRMSGLSWNFGGGPHGLMVKR